MNILAKERKNLCADRGISQDLFWPQFIPRLYRFSKKRPMNILAKERKNLCADRGISQDLFWPQLILRRCCF